MKTSKKVSTSCREEVIDQAFAFARSILGRRNRKTLKRRWFVRWDGRRQEVYKASEDDEYYGGVGYLEHDRILELYTAFPEGDVGTGWGWSRNHTGDTCETEAELRALIAERVADAADRVFPQAEGQISK